MNLWAIYHKLIGVYNYWIVDNMYIIYIEMLLTKIQGVKNKLTEC